jgi:iron complex transport system ATP-binding protein
MGFDAEVRLEASGVGFAYGSRSALKEIGMTASPGEVVGLLGPNGSGKSTLCRVFSGVLSGYTGSARVGGREVAQIPKRELARQLAVVPQEPTFGFPFTALEIVLMGRHPHLAGLAFESARDIALARRALEHCGASELAERPIQELSAGERQRVVFAKALAQEPQALILDEPASFLDIRHQVELYDIVRGLAKDEGRTVLTVLHDLNLAAEYCDRIYLLREGRVEAGGRTEEVFSYANLTRVFETEVYVDTHALTGRLLVLPLSGRVRRRLLEEES